MSHRGASGNEGGRYRRIILDADNILGSDDNAEVCVLLLRNQIQALAELIEPQRSTSRWRGDGVYTPEDCQNFVNDITARLFNQDDCSPLAPDDGCEAINAFHPAISYWPNHPVLGSGQIQGPYAETVWTTGAGYLLADANDAMVAPLSYFNASMVDLITFGLPSMTVHFQGAGLVRINFIGQIQGGSAWVFPDGNPLLGDFVDLDYREIQDWLSSAAILELLDLLAGGITSDVWYEKEFTTPGSHQLTAWFIPGLELEPPYGAAGGGVRGIDLCGPEMEFLDVPIDWTIVCNNGVITLKADGVDHSVIDLDTCGVVGPQGPQGPPGADGAQGPPGEDGADGADGAQGPPGEDGADGADGAQGPPGADGADGADGQDGAQGPPGAAGSDAAVITHQVYKDLRQNAYGTNNLGGAGYGIWNSGVGVSAGSSGFRVGWNAQVGQQILTVRFYVQYNVSREIILSFGLNLSGGSAEVIEDIPVDGEGFIMYEMPIYREMRSITGLQVFAESGYNPSVDGDLTWVTFDFNGLGLIPQVLNGGATLTRVVDNPAPVYDDGPGASVDLPIPT